MSNEHQNNHLFFAEIFGTTLTPVTFPTLVPEIFSTNSPKVLPWFLTTSLFSGNKENTTSVTAYEKNQPKRKNDNKDISIVANAIRDWRRKIYKIIQKKRSFYEGLRNIFLLIVIF